ncbi:MAG: TetR/AcrR family transcriptional regulator, partial [Lachnospiraceae bacterium]|nr:TetR/AcrR family transcriptional regulator [Lachnospiraceae bacterium]
MNKDEKLQNTKDRLIESTLILMENMDDPLNVTSRQIAAKAGVKPGMINYCFGSRENLIYQTFQKQYLSFLKEKNVEKILSSDLPPKELLKKIHFVVAKCLVENPKFTKAITGFVLFSRDLSKESFSFPYVKKHYAGKKTD